MLKKRDLIFLGIVTILLIFLLIMVIWSFFLDANSPLRGIFVFIGLNLIISILVIGVIGYLIDMKFRRSTETKIEKRQRFKDLTKNQKILTIVSFSGAIMMGVAFFNGEYFRIFLGSNIVTDICTVFTWVGLGVSLIGIALLIRISSTSSTE